MILLKLIFAVLLSSAILAAPAYAESPRIVAANSTFYSKENKVDVAVSTQNSIRSIRVVYCPNGLERARIACNGYPVVYRPRYICQGYCLWYVKFRVHRRTKEAKGYAIVTNSSGSDRKVWEAFSSL